jgi:hypothetical protein
VAYRLYATGISTSTLQSNLVTVHCRFIFIYLFCIFVHNICVPLETPPSRRPASLPRLPPLVSQPNSHRRRSTVLALVAASRARATGSLPHPSRWRRWTQTRCSEGLSRGRQCSEVMVVGARWYSGICPHMQKIPCILANQSE